MVELCDIVEHYAMAFKAVDAMNPVCAAYRPGIGPFGEPKALELALAYLTRTYPHIYAGSGPKPYPGTTKPTCDLVIPGAWAIEWKLLRPFGDNGKPAEHWSENVLHPYSGNTSSIGDCLKLAKSSFNERRGVLVFGYEHTPPQIPLAPAIQAFETIACQVIGISLGQRYTAQFSGLIHPAHQQGYVFGWEVLGYQGQ